MVSFLPLIKLKRKSRLISFARCVRVSFYVANTAALHHSQSLFVHYREQSQELPLSAQRLTHWLSGSIISPKGWIPRENLSPFHQRNFFPCTEEWQWKTFARQLLFFVSICGCLCLCYYDSLCIECFVRVTVICTVQLIRKVRPRRGPCSKWVWSKSCKCCASKG